MQDQFLQVGSVRTCYWSAGTAGPPVLLLHPMGACKEHWQGTIPGLARSHRVYAVDLPGFGLTDKPPVSYSLPYFTQFICDLLSRLNLDHVDLIGASLGGAIAVSVAIQHPDRVNKLVLADIPGLGKAVHPMLRLGTIPILGDFLTRPSRQNSRMVEKSCIYNPQMIDEQRIELGYQRSILPGAQAALASTSRALMNVRGVRDSVIRPIVDGLATITAPTLIIWGENDPVVPVALAQVAKERIPHSELLIFPQCGHVPYIDCLDKFNTAVSEFLDR